MTTESLPKAYEAQQTEERWRARWEDNHSFTPDADGQGEPFSIVIPPPNVTGALHIGHALNITLQDILCRHARQKGRKVLWIPGTDHAGISTQNVVERALAAEGLDRRNMDRDAFIARVWEWKEEYGRRILNQIKVMGASVDWTRERFTMDDNLALAVRRVFVRLYGEGLIYKGKYIVNWCTRCHTALSDDEVEHESRKASLWKVRYKLADGSGEIVVATTRPETILGDTAVAVHPEDERHSHLVGKQVLVPVVNRPVPVIADTYVDKDFGTGALKVTPCHDPNDWNLGHAHKLDFIQVIDDNGNMSAEAGGYAGLSREEARRRILAELEELGLLAGEEALEHNVGVCYRCGTVIEPYVSTQWFVATTKLAPQARAAVPDQIRIVPESWIKTYYNWLDNIRDWCISRQIWWGHRIPAWTCADCGELVVAESDPARCPKCGSSRLEQDPDVLDTWFSSALWPFSTMGWPEKTQDLQTFYPTSVLVTAFDILFFWVARMIMMGQHFMGEVPFRHVYIHALVRDAQGRKMSKSLGNGIDPIDMVTRYGADTLRFTLAAFAAMGRDIRMSEERIEGYRHFINKLWNAARFALLNLPDSLDASRASLAADKAEGLHHRWILHRLEECKENTAACLEAYRFNDAAQGLYKFLWNEFCDWYLELIKRDFRSEGAEQDQARHLLLLTLREILLLLHPLIPFVTAEIWQALPGQRGQDIAREAYPPARPACLRPADADAMLFLQESISAIRTIRAELNINPAYKLTVLIRPADEAQAALLEQGREWFMSMGRLESLTLDRHGEAPHSSASDVVRGAEIVVHLGGAVDFQAEIARLEKETGKAEKDLAGIRAKLDNQSFVSRAPAHIVEQERSRAADLEDRLAKMRRLAARFATYREQ